MHFGVTQIAAHGLTIPQRTLLEHNMLAVSAVYDNIRTDDLARILQVDTRSAEKVELAAERSTSPNNQVFWAFVPTLACRKDDYRQDIEWFHRPRR